MRNARIVARAAAGVAAVLVLASFESAFKPDRDARAPLLDGFGSVAMTVTTDVPEAQWLFTRGLLQTYAFNDDEAARAYRAALALDPRCAMCAWGVAKAAGPNINNVERGDLADARRHLAWARRQAEHASARERALVDALIDRYGPEPSGAPSASAVAAAAVASAPVCSASAATNPHPLDVVYAERMRAIADAYPDDVDVLVFYAEAATIATRGDLWDRKTGAPAGPMGDVADRLERALRTHPDHPGLNHFLIHAVDSSPHPERALAAADRLGRLAPESPHLMHMPAHIYVRLGRYRDAVRVNEEAIAAQARQDRKIAAQGFSASNDWNFHNRHFLWFAALTEGRGELALEQARALAGFAAKGKSASAEFTRSLPLLTLVRLERWDDVLGAGAPAGDNGIAGPIADYGAGVALVRIGHIEAARQRSARLDAALDAAALRGKTLMGDDPAKNVLEILARHLRGEIAVAGNDAAAARIAVGGADALEAALGANEPPILGSLSRVALGDLMLRAARWNDAESAFRAELAAQRDNGWALAGLQRALDRQGRSAEALRVRADAERAWSDADPSLRRLVLR
jgi:tetratricopeptide (TPR) repeat protein